VFTPIVGGTTKEDVQTGRVAHLAERGYPQRTTLMKVSKLSTLWDYINRAMPWTAPKSLAPDEVYAVLAYILNLGNIVPADFTLSDQNMAQVQERLPNRNGKVWHKPLWEVAGKGDVVNPLCMKNCPVEDKVASALPVDARNTHGNIAEQVRPFGEVRGTDTTAPPREALAASQPATTVAAAEAAAPAAPVAATPSTAAAPATGATAKPAAAAPNGAALVKANGCTACHGMSNKIVGPSFKDIAAKYAGTPNAASYLSGKIRSGGQGVWGPVPMPEQAQIKDADLRAMGQWLAEGGK
jgi:S-disulfanyl-L-cysteine oxidoreductase SoxD